MMMAMIRVEGWAASMALDDLSLNISSAEVIDICYCCELRKFAFFLNCGVCVYIHVCKNVSPCLCEEARRGH